MLIKEVRATLMWSFRRTKIKETGTSLDKYLHESTENRLTNRPRYYWVRKEYSSINNLL